MSEYKFRYHPDPLCSDVCTAESISFTSTLIELGYSQYYAVFGRQ